MGTAVSVATSEEKRYISRGRNNLQTVFERHFSDFVRVYEDEYADRYGKYRLERIKTIGEHFLACGDYLNGVAPESAVPTRNAVMIIFGRLAVKVSIFARHAIVSPHVNTYIKKV